jgi:beta-glucanase (GH16 family)
MDPSGLGAMTGNPGSQAAWLIGAALVIHFVTARSALSAPEHVRVLGHDARLTFEDEFEAPQLDVTGKGEGWVPWFLRFNVRTLKGNDERELYVDELFLRAHGLPAELNPFAVLEGALALTARRIPEVFVPLLLNPKLQFASGMLSSERSFAQTYGYFEIRARLPATRGTWPAFWLLPKSGTWPPEIDVFEVVGQEPARIHQNAIRADKSSSHTFVDIAPDATAWHTYGLLWTADEIVWFIDGRETKRAPNVADEPMYLIINLAVGGRWPGTPPDTEPFPATMRVDYVLAYALEGPDLRTLSVR